MNIKVWLRPGLTLTMLTALVGVATAQQESEPRARAKQTQAQPATKGKCDLAITKSLAHMMIHPPFQTGQQVTFEFFVTNHGTVTCVAPISVTDTFSAGLTYVSGGGSGWSCNSVLNQIHCNNNSLSLGPSQTSNFLLTFTVSGPPPSMTADCAVVKNTNDTTPGNNTACVDGILIVPGCRTNADGTCFGPCPPGQVCTKGNDGRCGCIGVVSTCGPEMCSGTCVGPDQGKVCAINPATGVCGCRTAN